MINKKMLSVLLIIAALAVWSNFVRQMLKVSKQTDEVVAKTKPKEIYADSLLKIESLDYSFKDPFFRVAQKKKKIVAKLVKPPIKPKIIVPKMHYTFKGIIGKTAILENRQNNSFLLQEKDTLDVFVLKKIYGDSLKFVDDKNNKYILKLRG